MVFNHDFFLVSVDQKYETTVSPAGIITANEAFIHKVFDNPWEKDKTDNRYEYKRIYGRVESCPRGYSETVVDLVDPGIPAPTKYIGHDQIMAKRKEGYKHWGRNKYCPTTWEDFDKRTMRDVGLKMSVERGDRVYFDYKVTEPENLMEESGGQQFYKVRADQILCSVRDGNLVAQGGWALVEPSMETWEEITTKSGIILKSQPEAKKLLGIVRVISDDYNIRPGDEVLYEVNADWKVKIEGETYYAIEERDILGKFVKE